MKAVAMKVYALQRQQAGEAGHRQTLPDTSTSIVSQVEQGPVEEQTAAEEVGPIGVANQH